MDINPLPFNLSLLAALLFMVGCAYQAPTTRYPLAPQDWRVMSDDNARRAPRDRQAPPDKGKKKDDPAERDRDRINRDIDKIEREIKTPLLSQLQAAFPAWLVS